MHYFTLDVVDLLSQFLLDLQENRDTPLSRTALEHTVYSFITCLKVTVQP